MFGTRVINYHEKNFEQRAAIKFCCKAVFTAVETWEMFVKVFGDSSVSRATVFQWHSQFVVNEELTEDAERSRRLLRTIKTNENIARVVVVLKDDSCASCRMIAESTGYQKPSFTTFCLMI